MPLCDCTTTRIASQIGALRNVFANHFSRSREIDYGEILRARRRVSNHPFRNEHVERRAPTGFDVATLDFRADPGTVIVMLGRGIETRGAGGDFKRGVFIRGDADALLCGARLCHRGDDDGCEFAPIER